MNKKVEVVRINVPKFGDILTARPEKLSYGEYRTVRALQNKRLKERLKGFLVYKASEIVKVGETEMLRKYQPCVGKKFVLNFQ
jgi:hypothetical protein